MIWGMTAADAVAARSAWDAADDALVA
jgi:hypothetical protein